jgi:hypothetical protein
MITLNDTLDVTANIAPVTSDSANYSDIFGLIAKQREYVLHDPDGRYHPYSARGYFNRYAWRAMSLRETDENGAIVFDGQIYDIEPNDDGKKRTITLYCRDPLGVKLDWYVDLCDLTTFAGWSTSGATSLNSTTVILTGAATDIVVNSVVSFNDEYTPSYLVTAVDTGTDTITLDRGLAEALPSGVSVNVAVPTLVTAAAAIKRALTAAGIGDRVDASFDSISTTDTTESRYLWFFVQPQNKIKLKDFIQQVQEMADIYISVSANGVIYARRGLAHDGVTIRKTISSAELIAPLSGPRPDTTRLIYGYDVLYPIAATSVQINGIAVPFTGEVRKTSNTVDAATLEDSAPTNIWAPVALGSSDLREYTILYWNESTAAYFGERRLSYFGVARPRIKVGLKRAKSGQPSNRYTIALFDDFKTSLPISRGQDLTDQNAVVMGYGYNAQNMRYDFVELELSGVAEAVNITRNTEEYMIYAKLSDTQSSGTDGGTFTSGAWQTRVLNTEDSDVDGIVSISGNQFTLQSGTYLIRAEAPGHQVDQHKIRLRNITDSADTLVGNVALSGSGSSATTYSLVCGRFTIISAKAFEIQHRGATTAATTGFGVNTAFSVSEVYTVVELWKIA